MKLIDILVEELPKLGGWPHATTSIGQDWDRELMFYGRGSVRTGIILDELAIDHRKRFDTGVKITREQYEAALASKNDDWIEWGGGECPVEKGALIDVKWRDGKIDIAIPAKMRCHSRERQAMIWHHAGHELDIIAYRPHKQQKAEQAKADDEADLNECIGQDAAPVWNGEGVTPPVGYMCERSWAGDEWLSCEILFASNQIVVVKLKESGIEDAYNIGDVTFRPIRSEVERKRDAAKNAIADLCMLSSGNCHSADLIYDGIAAGEIPGVKLED
ncbi:hypothetical protein PRB90_gp13 [Klebsiella phage BUCT610]|uniref:hypothetical protein n=1 Tax=Klebsiella phage BUCT610 TaxID=2834265 RepID=UPI001C792571|nr:hypothetical protein PRB90_gp13 [Klebsiella phage BUCT610]QWX10282.1 hypothetical protein [Klebsiella phage BUCT610]